MSIDRIWIMDFLSAFEYDEQEIPYILHCTSTYKYTVVLKGYTVVFVYDWGAYGSQIKMYCTMLMKFRDIDI